MGAKVSLERRIARDAVSAQRSRLDHEDLVFGILAEPVSEDRARRAAADDDIAELARLELALDALARDPVAKVDNAMYIERDETRGRKLRLVERLASPLVD